MIKMKLDWRGKESKPKMIKKREMIRERCTQASNDSNKDYAS